MSDAGGPRTVANLGFTLGSSASTRALSICSRRQQLLGPRSFGRWRKFETSTFRILLSTRDSIPLRLAGICFTSSRNTRTATLSAPRSRLTHVHVTELHLRPLIALLLAWFAVPMALVMAALLPVHAHDVESVAALRGLGLPNTNDCGCPCASSTRA